MTLNTLAREVAWFFGCLGVTLVVMSFGYVVNGYQPAEADFLPVAQWGAIVYVGTMVGRLVYWWFLVGARPDARP